MLEARRIRLAVLSSRPCNKSAAASAATIAAADDPQPAPSGIALSIVMARSSPRSSSSASSVAATRFEASWGSSSAPSPTTLTPSGPGRRSTDTRRRNGKAIAKQSYPGPRFAEDPGASTNTWVTGIAAKPRRFRQTRGKTFAPIHTRITREWLQKWRREEAIR